MIRLDNSVRHLLAWLSGSFFAQKILGRAVFEAQLLMGIGGDGHAASSGERRVLEWIAARVDGPLCIFDVGANVGQYLQMIKRGLPERELSVHCFEPSATAFEGLRRTAACWTRGQLVLNQVALGRAAGEGRLYFEQAGSPLASLSQRRLEHQGVSFTGSEAVRLQTLDGYCTAHGIGRIHLLKLDVEGHELDVLAGAEGLFNRREIDAVAFEFGGCNIDSRTFLRDFFHFFQKLDMDLLRITPSGYLFPLGAYREVYEQFRYTNFLAGG